MLTLFGFIKKELEAQGKLPDKFRDWKNTLYQDMIKFTSAVIPVHVHPPKAYYLFSPANKDCPVDLSAKDWSFSARVDVTSLGNTANNYQCALDVGPYLDSNDRPQLRIKLQVNEYLFGQYESVVSSMTVIERISKLKVGANYARMEYKASTKTMTAYYSTNGSSWTKFSTYTVKDPSKMKRIWIWQGHTKATFPVNEIKFIYDGEVLFGS